MSARTRTNKTNGTADTDTPADAPTPDQGPLGAPVGVSEALAVQEPTQEPEKPQALTDGERETIGAILAATTDFYQDQLKQNPEKLAYLHGRGLTDATITYFRLGYAPGHNALLRHLTEVRGHTVEMCHLAGVVTVPSLSKNDKGETDQNAPSDPYDYFRDAIIIPFLEGGGTVYMAGRSMSARPKKSKYICMRGPKPLFNVDDLKAAVAEALAGDDIVEVAAHVFEGLFDTIIAHQFGYKSVALVGTSLKDASAELFAHCDRVYITLDPDPAGDRAALKVGDGVAQVTRGKVWVVGLPDGVDPDDFLLGDGHGFGKEAYDALVADAEPLHDAMGRAWQEGQAAKYRETSYGMVWGSTFEAEMLANFHARIISWVLEDDGVNEPENLVEIEARHNGRTSRFIISADTFTSMNWPIKYVGPDAILAPGFGNKDKARTCIQVLSGTPPRRRVYKYTGFTKLDDGTWAFLHAGGAVGHPEGTVEVKLDEHLQRFILPEPPTGAELVTAINAVLKFVELGPRVNTVPLIGAVFRAPLGGMDFLIHETGQTGSLKTAYAVLAQQFYGAGMDVKNLPCGWNSTENSIETLTTQAKDVVLIIDNYVPGPNPYEAAKMRGKINRLCLSIGDRLSRTRSRSDGSLRRSLPPRTMAISTGEDIPTEQSALGRVDLLEFQKIEDLEVLAPLLAKLTACQADAAAGLYAQAMSAYVVDLAARYDDAQRDLPGWRAGYRDKVGQGAHARTPGIIADLAIGWASFLDFALKSAAITQEVHDQMLADGWASLVEGGKAQVEYQHGRNPADRFLELLKSALGAGACHVKNLDGGRPPNNPQAWGWESTTSGSGEYERIEWHAKGPGIGWVDLTIDALYLDPDSAFKVAVAQGSVGGEGLSIGAVSLWKRLQDAGKLVDTTDRKKHKTPKVQRTLAGQRRDVLHISIYHF